MSTYTLTDFKLSYLPFYKFLEKEGFGKVYHLIISRVLQTSQIPYDRESDLSLRKFLKGHPKARMDFYDLYCFGISSLDKVDPFLPYFEHIIKYYLTKKDHLYGEAFRKVINLTRNVSVFKLLLKYLSPQELENDRHSVCNELYYVLRAILHDKVPGYEKGIERLLLLLEIFIESGGGHKKDMGMFICELLRNNAREVLEEIGKNVTPLAREYTEKLIRAL